MRWKKLALINAELRWNREARARVCNIQRRRFRTPLQNSGDLLLCGSVQAQFPCLSNATQPVRRYFQDVNYGAGEMQRATEEVRLNQRRVELERQHVELQWEYAAYNADVSSYLHYNFNRQPNTGLYLPQLLACRSGWYWLEKL